MPTFTKKWNSKASNCGKLLFSSLLFTLLMLAGSSTYAITGTLTVCAGSTTSLSDPTPGGAWISSNGLVATVIGSSGVVTGVAAGTATIYYTVGLTATSVDVTVNPVPSGIGGAESVCNGSSITLSDFTAGGSWTSSGGVSLTPGTTTTVTGTSVGITVITYSLPTGCYRTYPITVLAPPAPIMGSLAVCTAGVTFLSDPTGIGSWAISPVGTATISPSGRVYGVSAGTATVTFTGANTCMVNATVTVNTAPGAIMGNMPICPASSVVLSDATGGGTWMSGNPTIVAVGSDGSLTGLSAGTANVYYSTGGSGCAVFVVVTVNAAPNAGTLSGSGTACTGATTSFSDAISGGVWSSTNMAVGTVNTSGVVRGLTVGTTTISYTVTNVCGTAAATALVTVGPGASAGTILGAGTLCAGSSIALSDAVTGGSWTSSTPAVGTVDATFGYVTGISAGTTMIYYTVTSSCGTASATTVITVNAFTAGTIGGASTVTAGLSITLTDAVMGGVWSTDNSNATVSMGVVTGVTAGTVTVSYTVTNGCGAISATKVVTIAPSGINPITGTLTVCVGMTTALTDATTGGAWTSGNTGVATVIGTSGVVTGVGAGTATIYYVVAGVPVVAVVTVNANPSAIGGPSSVCNGSSITLIDFTTGGTWTSTAGVSVTTGGTSSTVTGLTNGSNTVTYSLASGCYKTYPVVVNALPAAISGTLGVCTTGISFLSDASTPGAWTISPVGVATISPSGRVYGASAGTAVVTYTGPNTCIITATVTVTASPSAIMGNAAVCPATSVTLTNATGGGTWLSSNGAVATVGSSDGTLTGVAAGTANIYYSTGAGCAVMTIATVNANPNAGTLSGSGTVCTGSTTSFSDAIMGGVWSSTNMAVGTVNTSGVVRGLTVGTSTISYTVTNVCGSAAATALVTVGLGASAGTITGTASICAGATLSLTDAVTGGSWLSSTPSVGTVDASLGVVTGLSAGTTMIYYTITNSCGSATATTVVTVSAFTAGIINGTATVTAGLTTMLTDLTMGGVWSAENSNATVSGTGLVTAVTAGTVTISYTVTNSCGSISATKVVTVNASSVAPITGTMTLCVSSTTALSDITPGGVWMSGNLGVATVGTSGIVTGVGAGTASIYYTVAGVPVVTVVTVSAMPSGIGGPTSVCIGSSITLNDFTAGGTWTSTAGVSVTTGGTSSTVSGLTAGSNTVTYSLASGCLRTYPVVVKALPSAISGTLGVCTTGVSFLSDASTPGTWAISPVGTATISASGRVYGVSAGTAVVSYTGPNACTTTATVTVTPSPSAIMGNAPVCPSSSVTLTDAVGGGTWLSSNGSVATVGSSDGTLTGVAAGTANIYYSTGAGCSVMTIATVNANPNAGTLSGSGTACTGATTSFSDAIMGGVWSSTNMAVGTVNTSGVVRGLTVGATTISYTVTNVCGTAAATALVTVGLGASAGTITGNAPVCAGSSLALTDATSGGSWSGSTPTVASVDAVTGTVAGLSGGIANIYYTVTNSCGSASAAVTVTVNAFSAGTITGIATVTAGLTTPLADLTMGGVWSAENSNATVSGTGLVTGIAAGTVTISYTVTNGCGSISATKVVTVNASSVSPITGLFALCVSSTSLLSDITPGGSWTSGNTAVATVGGTSGIVTGVGAGVAPIYYTVAGVPVVTIVTVSANPSGIGGATGVCNGSSITLSDFTPGGIWTSTGGVSVTTGTTVTTVTGLVDGVNVITYSLGSGCYKTFSVNVKPIPTSILGICVVCGIGSVTFLSDATSGTAWSISPVSVATVSPSGRVYGVSGGTATVTYTASNGCIATTIVTVGIPPVVSAILGANNVSHGATINLSDLTTGGTWTSSNPAIASVNTGGDVFGVATSGTAIISYTITYPSATCGASSTKSIAVHTPAPHMHAGSVDGSVGLMTGASVNLDEDNVTGEWSSSNNDVATVEDGNVIAIAPGNASIIHVITNNAGVVSSTVTKVVVSTLPIAVNIVPNPNSGAFTLRGTTGGSTDEEVTLEVTNVMGQVIYTSKVTAVGGKINENIALTGSLANGMYMLNVHTATGNKAFHFVMEK